VFVVWGTRNAGKVDQRDGQYALTRFAHVYWLPLFPTSAIWVTSDGVGHDMKLSGKSVVAGYARTWAVVAAVAGVVGFGGTLAFAAAIGAVALGALSLAWTNVTSDSAMRRSDLNLLAFGTRCEPKLLPAPLVETLTIEAKERWATVSDGQSPGDVARFGPNVERAGLAPASGGDDLERAAAAYGVLRLTALSLPKAQADEAEADAKRIAEGVREKLQVTEGGPYRSAAVSQRLFPAEHIETK
jgi:hypothetical protein